MNRTIPITFALLLASFTTPIAVADDTCQVTSQDGTVSTVPCCDIPEYAEDQSRCAARFIVLIGTSVNSWEEAAKNAIEAAKQLPRDFSIAKVTDLDMEVENGKVTAYRARVSLSFKYE